jgi:cytidylate kinase
LLDLQRRDARDSEREAAPLQPAEGALLLDSTALTVDQTVDAVLRAWRDACGGVGTPRDPDTAPAG